MGEQTQLKGTGNLCDEEQIDWIVTTDTIYHQDLIRPLFDTMDRLVTRSQSLVAMTNEEQEGQPSPPPQPAAPRILVAVERRDPILLDRALDYSDRIFVRRQIDPDELKRAASKWGGKEWDWEEMEDVEVWELTVAG